jgi:hypothetical protein
MAVAALVARNLGFDNVTGCLIADKKLKDRHIIEIEITGPYNEGLRDYFKCTTVRSNPAHIGQVTGAQTYESFFYSLMGFDINFFILSNFNAKINLFYLETLGGDNQHGIIVC